MWLTALDTSAIQSYIFGSNRLRENVGASHLVHLATEGWLLSEPDSLLPQHHNILDGKREDNQRIEDGSLAAELIYAGGGNTMILTARQEDARAFAGRLSGRILREAPGLDVVLASEPFKWEEPLAQAMRRVMDKLAARKGDRECSHPLLGLGITAACQSTGLPATDLVVEPSEPDRPTNQLIVSPEVAAKWAQNVPAKQRLRRVLFDDQQPALGIPDRFDALGRSEGESSYIAVVHADGNSMSTALEQIRMRYQDHGGEANRNYIRELRQFSDLASKAGQNALRALIAQVATPNPALRRAAEQNSFPLRPLVYGGDDVTFVCDGRIGVKAAQLYLEAFGQQRIPTGKLQEDLQPGVACAGVAIVKVRYPFARAFQLSEQLCKNAKDAYRRRSSALDWHLAQSGLFGSLREIRGREYSETWDGERLTRSLLMRPVTIGSASTNNWHTWQNFSTLLDEFRNEERWPRNKVMTLREALRDGHEAVRSFVSNYGRELPTIETQATEYRRDGWDGGRCVYFDAIEMIEQEVLA